MVMRDRNYWVDEGYESPGLRAHPKSSDSVMGTTLSQSDAPDQHSESVGSDRGCQGNEGLFMGAKAALSPAGVVASVHRCSFLTWLLLGVTCLCSQLPMVWVMERRVRILRVLAWSSAMGSRCNSKNCSREKWDIDVGNCQDVGSTFKQKKYLIEIHIKLTK